MQEKKQRIEDKKRKMTAATSPTMPTTHKFADIDDVEEEVEEKHSGPEKTLKIEVHATATHHKQVEPIVSHAQNHEFSHNQAVSTYN